jgi:thioredoxin reductase
VLTHTVVLGAGPYGLAAAASLRDRGVPVRVIGRSMDFWERMPEGMLLRSPYVASSIGSPTGPRSLDAFATDTGTTIPQPVPLEQFVEYGRWVQRHAVPDLDTREVCRVDDSTDGFRLELEDGDEVLARRLIVAAGIGYFPRIPTVFHGLPDKHVSHASAHRDLSVFCGRRVLVIGAGQSALESAALLRECGAEVQIAARAEVVHWLRRHPWLRSLGPISEMIYAPAEVGPPVWSRLVEVPHLVSRMPASRRHQLDRRSIRPAGAAWLRPRVVDSIPLSLNRQVVGANSGADGVTVTFEDGEEIVVDHVLLGTGYRVDLSRYPFLSPELLARIRRSHGYPVVGRGFESSVPGLHFLGAPSAWRFGPLMRFVAGTDFTARELARALTRPTATRRGRAVALAA